MKVNRNLAAIVVVGIITMINGCAQTAARQMAKSEGPQRHHSADDALREKTTVLPVRPKYLSPSSEIRLISNNQPTVPRDSFAESNAKLESSSHTTLAYLTLADLELLALNNNPTLTQAEAAVDQQRGEYRQSGLYPNPQVGYLNTTANRNSPKKSNGVFLSQEFVTANKISLAQEADSVQVNRTQWDHEAQQLRVLNDVRIRHLEVLGAQRSVAISQELEQLSRKHLTAAEDLFQSKTAPKTDVLQAQVLLESSQVNLEEAKHRLEAAWAQLTFMVGVPSLPLTHLSEDRIDVVPNLDMESEWDRLLAESPQLRSVESELDHGFAVLRQAQAQAKPNITLQLVADYDEVTQSTTASTLLALPLPIFNRNQGNIDKATADIRANQAEIVRSQLVLRDQLADSFKRFKTSRMQAGKLKESILPALEENLKLMMAAYKGGEISFRDVLTAQESFAQSRIAHIEAIIEAQKVAVEITGMQLTGGLNPAAIGSAIQTQSGSGQRQRALLQEVQDGATKQLLPATQIGR